MLLWEGSEGRTKPIGIKNRTCISIIEASERSYIRFGIGNLTGANSNPYHGLLLP